LPSGAGFSKKWPKGWRKNFLGYDKVRYRGLSKNESRLYTLFASANLLVVGRSTVTAPTG
jgi:IS5 family transposase